MHYLDCSNLMLFERQSDREREIERGRREREERERRGRERGAERRGENISSSWCAPQMTSYSWPSQNQQLESIWASHLGSGSLSNHASSLTLSILAGTGTRTPVWTVGRSRGTEPSAPWCLPRASFFWGGWDVFVLLWALSGDLVGLYTLSSSIMISLLGEIEDLSAPLTPSDNRVTEFWHSLEGKGSHSC